MHGPVNGLSYRLALHPTKDRRLRRGPSPGTVAIEIDHLSHEVAMSRLYRPREDSEEVLLVL